MTTERYHNFFEQANNDSFSESSSHHSSEHQELECNQTGMMVTAPGQSTSDEARHRRRATAIFSICTILLFADQNLMGPNLTAIAEDFGFDDNERDRKLGGDISLAFFLLGAPASFIVGVLADQSDRSFLFALTVGIGEGACVASFWARTYGQLYICRAVTGFSLGGALPLIYSILGDLFPAEERHPVSAVVSVGIGAGIGLGQAVAGFLGPTFGWRLPFLVVGIPSIGCALSVYLFVNDPPRGSMEKAVLEPIDKKDRNDEFLQTLPSTPSPSSTALDSFQGNAISTSNLSHGNDVGVPSRDEFTDEEVSMSVFQLRWDYVIQSTLRLLSTPTLLLGLLQGTPGCVPWGIFNSFLTDFLAQDRGFSVEAATSVMILFGLGHVFGLALGGGGGRYLYRLDNRYPSLLAGCSSMLGCIPFWVLLNYVDATTPYWRVTVVAMSMGLLSGPTGPIIKTTITNVTLPRSRGQAFALFNLFDDFGKGLGPFFISILISRMGRLTAFNVGVLGSLLCGLLNASIFFTVKKDEESVQATLVSELSSFPSSSSLKDTASLLVHQEGNSDVELSSTHYRGRMQSRGLD